jgi:Cu+-exporting ATPase
VEAEVSGRQVLIGSAVFLRDRAIDVAPAEHALSQVASDGKSLILVAVDGRFAGWITLADELRMHAREAAQSLTALGVTTALVTGDNWRTAQVVAKELGIPEVHAEMSPEGKRTIVEQRRERGGRVAFVGDGINDAPALAAADVGITFASAADIASGAADVTIVHEDLRRLPAAVRLARRSIRIIKQNLFWAFFYNVAAIPLAAAGIVAPGVAAAAMMLSSISVVLNSLRLRSA